MRRSEARPPQEVKLTPQNLQLLVIFYNVYIRFPSPFTNFFGIAAPKFCCKDFLMLYSYETAFSDTFPREVSRAEKLAPNSDWSLK